MGTEASGRAAGKTLGSGTGDRWGGVASCTGATDRAAGEDFSSGAGSPS